jgi:hypothetical protein
VQNSEWREEEQQQTPLQNQKGGMQIEYETRMKNIDDYL